jgi:hypothetical protein
VLRLGLKLCSEMLPSEQPNVVSMSLTRFVASGWEDWGAKTGLIDRNGDAEMWLRLCNLGNRPVVRVVFPGNPEASAGSLYWGDDYPATAPAMDQHGRVTSGIAADNYFPVCARGAPGPAVGAAGAVIPACPSMLTDTVDASGNKKYLLKTVTTSVGPDYVDARKWAARGAINAALAVFLYLDGVERGTVTPKPPFDQCEKR